MPNEPRINEKFPIKDGDQLSPPIVDPPIHQCAEIVSVKGFVPHATVRIYVNLTELVGEDNPPFGFGDIRLMRPLKLGESITATQTVQHSTSAHSIQPIIVSSYLPGQPYLPKPTIAKDIFECGQVVPVDKLVPSVVVHVYEDTNEIGAQPTAQVWCPILTQPLHASRTVTALQLACEHSPDYALKSPESDPVLVKPAPNPVPSPSVDPNSLVPGNDAVVLANLYCGAGVTVFDHGASVGGGYATESANWCSISPPLQTSSMISAVQTLCTASKPSEEVRPTGKLEAPVVLGPICEGTRFVIVRKTTVNANVVLLCGGKIIGYGGAVLGDLVLGIGGNVQLMAGDKITAYQTMGMAISPVSNEVTVVGKLEVPAIEIVGGEPFFLPEEATDQPIDGPVFPRGRGEGPLIKIQACCTKEVSVAILGPDSELVAKPEAIEIFPGYYTAQWDWQSVQGWKVPSGIPIGAYTVVVKTGCDQEKGQATFYVIFNPADVNGPPRFSFNKTAIWFGSGINTDWAYLYYLHTNDARVFGMAINGASGMTDPVKAAETLSLAVYKRFISVDDHGYHDVIDLLEDDSKRAQCSDEACCLIALLRSIGIPSHPVTADFACEITGARWGFDTWIEFLASTNGGSEWMILHPHEYPNDASASRPDFGKKGVASNDGRDLIIMANENWVSNEASDGSVDVSFNRNECNQPNQQITAKPWVDHICEQGYWEQPHWDCTGVTPYSIRIPLGFRLEGSRLRFGGELVGTVTLRSDSRALLAERVTVELFSHRLESKALVNETFDAVSHQLVLEPKREITLPFRLQLPGKLTPGYELYLRARVSERTLLLQPIHLPIFVESEIRMPRELTVGQNFVVTTVVRNITHEVVNGISLALSVPYAINLHRRQSERMPQAEELAIRSTRLMARIESLPPGGEKVVEWAAQALASLEAGTVRLELSSENGGSNMSMIPVRVFAPPQIPVAMSSVIPQRKE